MIRAQQLTKRYGGFAAVDGASFEVEKGRVAGFLGLNGAGKTTTMRMISCFMPPTSGSVSVAGFDSVSKSEEVRARIGYLPERVPVYDDMRVEEYLSYRAKLKGVRGGAVREAVDSVIGRCSLDSKRRSLNGTLSKGQRQRVGLADALVHDPELLILDEPTSGLDPDQRIGVRGLIREIGSERTVLLSTHILSEAEAVCDDVVVIHRGRIRATDTLDGLRGGGSSGYEIVHLGEALPAFDTESIGAADLEDGPGVILRVADRTACQAALRQLLDASRTVVSVREARRTLEEAFIELTARAERES